MKSWEPCDKYIFSGVDLNSNPHTFNNLEGDKYDYRLYCTLSDSNSANVQLNINFNGDTGANYRRYLMYGYGANALGSVNDVGTLSNLTFQGSGLQNNTGLSITDILGNSGNERTIATMIAGGWTSDTYIYNSNDFWQNTADELTSIVVSASTTDVVTGETYLFRRQKESVYNASDWELVEDYTFSGVDLNANPKTFNNLQGDVDKEYMVEFQTDTSSFFLTYNGDIGSNYTYQQIYNNAGTLLSFSGTGTSIGNLLFDGRITLNAVSGKQRASIHSSARFSPSAFQTVSDYWWTNTVDEITSLTFAGAGTGSYTGYIRLYKRSKNRSTPSHERLVYDYDISGDFSAGKEFKNLDTNKMYRVDLSGLKSSADFDIEMEINGDTGANYIQQYLRGSEATASAATGSNNEVIPGKVSSDYPGIGSLLIFPKTGAYRPMIITQGYELGGDFFTELEANWWANTADSLQDMKLFASAATSMTGNIKIWEIAI